MLTAFSITCTRGQVYLEEHNYICAYAFNYIREIYLKDIFKLD